MSPLLHRTALAACCATAALGLAACSSTATSSTAAASGGSSATPAATATSAQADPNAGIPTGTKLASALLTAAAVPSSLKVDASGSQNTGDVFAAPSTAAAPAAKVCDTLDGTSWISASGIGSASFAQSDFTDSYSDMFAQEIDAYRGSDATTVMTRLEKAFSGCATFKVTQSGTTYTAKLASKHLTGLGDQALEAVITSSSWSGGSTLIAARVGSLVVTTMYNDQQTTGSADLALTKSLLKKVAAAG